MIPLARRRHALACLTFLTLTGCGSNSVSGKVTYNGKPLVGGTVTFFTADQQVKSSVIGADGTYAIDKLATGPAKITVSPPVPPPRMPTGMRMDPKKMGAPAGEGPRTTNVKPVSLPAKYTDPAKTELTYTVTSGKQEHDIDLK